MKKRHKSAPPFLNFSLFFFFLMAIGNYGILYIGQGKSSVAIAPT